MDLMTVISMGTLLTFVIGIAMILTPSEDSASRRGARIWGMAMLIHAAGLLVAGNLRPSIPLLMNITLGNALLLTSIIMCMSVIANSKAVTLNVHRYYVTLALLSVAFAALTWQYPDKNAYRILLASVFACFVYGRVSALILLTSKPNRSEVFTGAVFLICTIALLARVIVSLTAALGDNPSLPLSSQVNMYTYLSMSTAGILMTFGYLLMGHDHDIRELREIESRMRHLAQHDVLTDLPNRALFNDRLERAMANARRENKRLALMFLDVNRFKSINDNLGHGVGDAYLQELARRLRTSVREQDTAARIGGDEFVILLPVIQSPADARTIADKVMNTLEKPVMIEGSELRFYVSVGIACYPEDGSTVEVLQQAADRSMYAAKSAGDNEVRLHSEQKPVERTADLFAQV